MSLLAKVDCQRLLYAFSLEHLNVHLEIMQKLYREPLSP